MQSRKPQLELFAHPHFLLTQWHPSAGPHWSCLHWMGCSVPQGSRTLHLNKSHPGYSWGSSTLSLGSLTEGQRSKRSQQLGLLVPSSPCAVALKATTIFRSQPHAGVLPVFGPWTVCVHALFTDRLWFQYWWFSWVCSATQVLHGVGNRDHCQFSVRVFWCHYPNTYLIISEVSSPVSFQPLQRKGGSAILSMKLEQVVPQFCRLVWTPCCFLSFLTEDALCFEWDDASRTSVAMQNVAWTRAQRAGECVQMCKVYPPPSLPCFKKAAPECLRICDVITIKWSECFPASFFILPTAGMSCETDSLGLCPAIVVI